MTFFFIRAMTNDPFPASLFKPLQIAFAKTTHPNHSAKGTHIITLLYLSDAATIVNSLQAYAHIFLFAFWHIQYIHCLFQREIQLLHQASDRIQLFFLMSLNDPFTNATIFYTFAQIAHLLHLHFHILVHRNMKFFFQDALSLLYVFL